MAGDSEFTPVVRRLACLRGISTRTSFALAVEVGDWDRLSEASIGAYLALVPTEPAFGPVPLPGVGHQDRQCHARRLLVEAAWHHRKPYRTPGAQLRVRWALASLKRGPAGTPATSGLHQRWLLFTERKKETGGRRRRGRPRADRLVLVPGRHGRLTAQALTGHRR